MSVTAASGPAPHHPWLATFERAPVQAFGDLLAGYARVPPYERADAPDAARMLFGPLPADDPARVAIGPAILGWLRQRRREPPPATAPRRQRWVREICEAFEIVALLDVADAAADLRRHYVAWNEWSARFVLSPARDAHAEYWRMLALTQPLLTRSGAVNQADALAALWVEISRLAGDPLPRHYLEIGLLGLRRLPQSPAGSEAPWVAGLAHWALAQKPTRAEFQAEWLALKPLYPRTAERWRELVARLLATSQFRDMRSELQDLWLGDPDFRPLTRSNYHPAGAPLRSPSPEDCNAEIERFEQSWARVEPRLDILLQRHRLFLSATGDPQYFVRAVHAVGVALIRPGADQPGARARKAQTLVREGLEWQPYDRYLWALWRDALAAEGALEAAELIGWEAIRRDPDHVDARNQLSTLLAEALHRPDDAEALLRDTITAFPDNAVARTQLATLLAEALHRPDDAEALLRDTTAAFPDNAFPRNQLAELLIAADRLADAETVVDAAFTARAVGEATYALRARLQSHRGLARDAAATLRDGLARRFPSDRVLQDYQRILASGRPLPLLRAAMRRPTPQSALPPQTATPHDPALDDTIRYGRLRRLRARAETGDPAARQAALDEVRAILRDDPAFAYAGVLAARFGAVDSADMLPSFAVAFEQALAQGDRARLEALAKQQPRLQALTLVARAVLGDESAAWLVEALLKAPPERHEARPVSILRAGLQSILAAANDLPAPQAILRHRDAVLRRLYDANEAALGDRIAA
ncbi:MAG TPA: tetratricopeptide repeat protein [Acetobacteraceae bacterium]|jgi:Tfp pilus assembly protein PilF